MRLRDRLFLSYGMLWDRRYGRIISYVLEFLIVSLAAAVLMSVLWGIAIMSYEYAQYHIEQEAKKRSQRVEAQRDGYERVVLACLNRQYFLANNELFVCEAK